jgi:hypothetical protein
MSMDYSYRLFGSHGLVIDAVGEIVQDEKAVFVSWWYSLPREIQLRKTVGWVFNSTGGSVPGAMDIGRFIARGHANTGVTASGVCASACVLIWANGAVKSAAPTSHIGVHNTTANGGSGNDFVSFGADTITGKYLAALGAPASVVGHLVITPADSVYWLTPDELAAWNVKITF